MNNFWNHIYNNIIYYYNIMKDKLFLILILIIVLYEEYKDRQKYGDINLCSNLNHCNKGIKNDGIKYVELKSITEKDKKKVLLNKIKDVCNVEYIFWRISLIISCVACLFMYFYSIHTNIKINKGYYMFLFVVIWFFNYWGRNYLDFHYIKPKCNGIDRYISLL